VLVTRAREDGVPVLRIADDGEGVDPDAPTREEALERLARNIGHSRKHKLTLEQRRGALGQYGIGLLGFWCLGEQLELVTRVRDSVPFALVLREDDPSYSIDEATLCFLGEDDPLGEPTCTEVVIRQLHESTRGALTGRRLADYLGVELRR